MSFISKVKVIQREPELWAIKYYICNSYRHISIAFTELQLIRTSLGQH